MNCMTSKIKNEKKIGEQNCSVNENLKLESTQSTKFYVYKRAVILELPEED